MRQFRSWPIRSEPYARVAAQAPASNVLRYNLFRQLHHVLARIRTLVVRVRAAGGVAAAELNLGQADQSLLVFIERVDQGREASRLALPPGRQETREEDNERAKAARDCEVVNGTQRTDSQPGGG